MAHTDSGDAEWAGVAAEFDGILSDPNIGAADKLGHFYRAAIDARLENHRRREEGETLANDCTRLRAALQTIKDERDHYKMRLEQIVGRTVMYYPPAAQREGST